MRWWRHAAACISLTVALVGCDSSPDRSFDGHAVDAEIGRMIDEQGLSGAAIRVRIGGEVVHERAFGDLTADTAVPSASASKWLTAAAIMTLVDDGLVSLDAPISEYLDGLDGEVATITLRRLLSHTSGLPAEHPCPGSTTTTLEGCARAILDGGLDHPPGQFAYGSPGFTVAGFVAETVTGRSWPELFAERITRPLGIDDVKWGDIRGGPTDNPEPAAGATISLDDYDAFLTMLLDDGTRAGRRILRPESVHEIESPQVELEEDRWYGLGTQLTRLDDGTLVVSSPGLFGFRPWLERGRGLVAVFVMDRMTTELGEERAGDGGLQRAVRGAVDAA